MVDYRNEAINFATLCATTGESEKVIEPYFEQIGSEVSLKEPLLEHLRYYQKRINLPRAHLVEQYQRIEAAFAQLTVDDIIVRRDSVNYPQSLRMQSDSPRYLYLRGDIGALRWPLVAVVGSRTPSRQAQQVSQQCVHALQGSDYLLLAALAGGVSAITLMSSLRQERPVVAVLETSLLETSSPRYAQLQEFIGGRGLLVTQFSPDQKSERWFAPLRNRLLALLAQAMLIVEERDGGFAIHQAEYALTYQRPLLVFKESMTNRSLLWPRRFQEHGIVSTLQRPTELPKALAQLVRTTTVETSDQLSLFE